LISHAPVNAISAHFEIPKLSQLTRSHIAPTLDHYWFDSAFLDTVTVALSSKDPYLQRLLVAKSREHLDSLITSPEFDHSTMLRSFHSTFRVSSTLPQTTAEADSSAKLQELRGQVSTTSSERDDLQQQLAATLSENKELCQRVAEISSERDQLQQRVQDKVVSEEQCDIDFKERLEVQQTDFKKQLAAVTSENDRLRQSVTDLSSAHQLLQQRMKGEEQKASQSTRELAEASAARVELQNELTAYTAKNNQLRKEISAISSGRQLVDQDLRAAEGKVTEYAKKLGEKSKAQEAAERELRVASSERALLRKRWDQEREKVITLTKSNEDLSLALELEKNSDASVLARKRDDLKKALEDEQKEVARLIAENKLKAETLAAANKKADVYAAQKLRLETQYSEELKRSNSFKAERDVAKQNAIAFMGREHAANNKITKLIDTVHNHEWCRNCGDNFGSWIEDDGSCLILRCLNCRCRHYN
jgi:DNA repair exonuclease SbcCD ATPase subunit